MKKRTQLHIKNIIRIMCLMVVFVFSSTLQAASVSIQTVVDKIHAQDVFVVTVGLDTGVQDINAVEGEFVIGDVTKNFEVRDIAVAGSGLTLWPRKPSLSSDGTVIAFAGGVPGSVKGIVPLFKIVLFARNPGELRIAPKNIVMYAADGKGTSLSVEAQDKIVSIDMPADEPLNGWRDVVATDNNAPQPFDITLHQDPSLYEGKKFLSFPALDLESGIAYYEVSEGEALPVRSGDQYVLVDQNKKQEVIVTAFDAAGNARVGIFTGKTKINWAAIIFWTIILFIIARRQNIINFIKRKKGNRAKVF